MLYHVLLVKKAQESFLSYHVESCSFGATSSSCCCSVALTEEERKENGIFLQTAQCASPSKQKYWDRKQEWAGFCH